MKQFGVKITILAVCLLMLFATACGDSGEGQSGVAMGRYMESVADYPMAYPQVQHLRSDGSLELYGYSDEGDILLYNTRDGQTWEEREIIWELQNENASVSAMAYDSDDTLYLLAGTYEITEDGYDRNSMVYKVLPDGTLEDQNIQWQDPYPELGVITDSIGITEDGNYLIGQTGIGSSGIYQYGSDGRFVRMYQFTPNSERVEISIRSGSDSGQFVTIGNVMYMQDSGSGSILAYDTTDGTLRQNIPFENFTGSTVIGKGMDDAIYLQNNGGLYRLMSGGSVWEKLIDGELTSMSLPSLYFGYFLEMPDGTFFIQGGDMESSRLYSYRYDETVPTVPIHELVVYALTENDFVRQAVGDFQRMYPDTKVSIQVGNIGGSTTTSDQIRALNTELLAGKGPDVLILDGMNMDSFIRKGVLADITEVITAAQQNDKGILDQVVCAYENEGKVYAIPTKFTLPLVFGDESELAQMQNLAGVAAFAQENQELGVMGDLNPELLIEAFLPASAPVFLKQGQIDEEALGQFLTALRQIANVSAESYPSGDGEGMSDEIFHYAFGRSHLLAEQLKGFGDLMGPAIAMEERDGGNNKTMTYLPGLTSKVFIPVNISGINTNSKQQEKAMDFISLMLADEAQSINIEDGFPVNINTLENSPVIKENIYMGLMSDYQEGETLMGGYPSMEYQEQLLELAKSVEVPYTSDPTLVKIIVEEAKDCIGGEKTIDRAIADIQERTKLYLSE